MDVGKINSGNTAIFKSPGKVDGFYPGGFGPSFDCNQTVPGINTYNNLIGKSLAGILDKIGVLDSLGTDNDPFYAQIQVHFSCFCSADSATHLDISLYTFNDFFYRIQVFRAFLNSAVKVNYMNNFSPFIFPALCHGGRIIGENRFGIKASLKKSHTFTVFDIDCGYDKHVDGCSLLVTGCGLLVFHF